MPVEPFDPQIAALLAVAERERRPELWEQTVQQARAGFRREAALRSGGGLPVPVAAVADGELSGAPIRTYSPVTPAGPAPPTGHATVAYFHGGGWVLGDLDTHDQVARTLCNRLGATVVSVDYPLAPENPYPAALESCSDVVEVLAGRGPVAAAGDSAGGNLATAVCLRNPAVTAQLLLYPCLDATQSSPSFTHADEGYGLTARSMAWFWGQYGVSAGDPLGSPLAAADLTGQPPAVIATAGYDPLCDEGEEYAERLAAAGVPVRTLRYPTLNHSFFAIGAHSQAAAAAIEEICRAFRTVLGGVIETSSTGGGGA